MSFLVLITQRISPHLSLSPILGQSEAVRCFRCSVTVEPKHNKTMLCTKFDGSSNFVVDCPHSTMCVKTVLRSQLAGNQVETVIRDCAQQKFIEQVSSQFNVLRIRTLSNWKLPLCRSSAMGSGRRRLRSRSRTQSPVRWPRTVASGRAIARRTAIVAETSATRLRKTRRC